MNDAYQTALLLGVPVSGVRVLVQMAASHGGVARAIVMLGSLFAKRLAPVTCGG